MSAPDSAPDRAGVAPRWGLGDAVLAYAVGFVGSAFFANLWAVATSDGTKGHPNNTLGLIGASLLGLWLGLLGVTVWVSRRKGTGSLARDFGLAFARQDILIGVIAGVATQVVLIPVLYLPVHLLWPHLDLGGPAKDALGKHGVPVATVVRVALVAVGAPIIEELFFRGLLLRSLARRLGDLWAVVISAAVFGLTHFEGPQLPALFAFGVVLGVLAVRSKRLGPSIVAHVTFNALAVVTVLGSR